MQQFTEVSKPTHVIFKISGKIELPHNLYNCKNYYSFTAELAVSDGICEKQLCSITEPALVPIGTINMPVIIRDYSMCSLDVSRYS